MDRLRDERLVLAALQMAQARRQPGPGLLHHSDRGSQNTSSAYQALQAQHGIAVSMSHRGNCYDKALMERCFATLKAECVDRHVFQALAEAQTTIFEYLEVLYNRHRVHSALHYCAPLTFEQAAVPWPFLDSTKAGQLHSRGEQLSVKWHR